MSFVDASRLAQEAAVKHRTALEQSGKCGFRLFDLAAGVDGPTALEENCDMLKKTDVARYEAGGDSIAARARSLEDWIKLVRAFLHYEEAGKRWIARISENGKPIGKSFPVKRYRTEGMSFADASRLA